MKVCARCKRQKEETGYKFSHGRREDICRNCRNRVWQENQPESYRKLLLRRNAARRRARPNYRKARKESSVEQFLKLSIKNYRWQDMLKGRQFDVDLAHLLELYDQQAGRCAITNIVMSIKDDLRAISVDRIDSSIGHIKGNIQLVCRFANIGKMDHPNAEVHSIFDEIRTQTELALLRKMKENGFIIERRDC